jgi:tetratricopeptide (TPR) repeat protein
MTKAIATIVSVVLLAGGVALLAYARWTRAIGDGDAALAGGNDAQAVAAYQTAEARFDGLPAVRQLAAMEYSRVVGNHMLALYRSRRYDEVIDLAQKAPADAAPHFWSGCALFQKATAEGQPEARLGWLSRAEDELRKAVEATPDDWDTKFDFELTTRLAAELRRQPNTPPKQLMQLLRPPTAGQKTPRRIG